MQVWLDIYIYASLTPATEQMEIDLRIRPLHLPSHIRILALLVLVRSSDHGQRGLLLSPNGIFPKLLDLWIPGCGYSGLRVRCEASHVFFPISKSVLMIYHFLSIFCSVSLLTDGPRTPFVPPVGCKIGDPLFRAFKVSGLLPSDR